MPSLKLTDDLGRTLVFVRPPARIVSLVPSDTYSLVALGAADRLVGRTRFCETPEAAHAAVVGGTKDIDVDAVLALAPQLVVANQEENTRVALEALAKSVPVLVSLPRRVSDGIAHLARLARILDVGAASSAGGSIAADALGRSSGSVSAGGSIAADALGRSSGSGPARSLIRRAYALRDRLAPGTVDAQTPSEGTPVVESRRSRRETVPGDRGRVRAFIPIWNDPLMTLNADTFGSDVLAQVGIANVFGQRLRLYPLAADLGKTAPQDAGGRDVRYPRISMFEVKERDPALVVLPDEPYAFTADEEAEFRAALPNARIVRVTGKDLFWYGAWTIDALDRLARELAAG